MQKYKLLIFDTESEYLRYKSEMTKKYHIKKDRWIFIGKFLFNHDKLYSSKEDLDPILELSGNFSIYVRFGYCYLINNDEFNNIYF